MLNLSLKTRQNKFEVNNREWTTARKTCTLAMASANSCRAYCSRATGTAAWKGRRNRPLTSGFLLVESALNNSRLITFCDIATFCHRQMGPNFGFHRIFVQHFVHVRGVYLGITAQRHKLSSICRNTKSEATSISLRVDKLEGAAIFFLLGVKGVMELSQMYRWH